MKKSKLNLYILLIVILIVSVYVFYWIFLFCGLAEAPQGVLGGVRSGTFGDAFGVINALFSALACSGVVATLLYQRRDLQIQKEKSDMQQFESQFYNRLTLQQNIVDRLDLADKETKATVATGRDCIRNIYRNLKRMHSSSSPNLDHAAALRDSYSKIWSNFHSDLGIYMRSLYSVFKFVSESDYPEKKKLGIVVRSLLSDFELAIIFYNCLSSRGENFRRYAEEFELFDNLDVDLLVLRDDVVRVPKVCWGRNLDALSVYAEFEIKE